MICGKVKKDLTNIKIASSGQVVVQLTVRSWKKIYAYLDSNIILCLDKDNESAVSCEQKKRQKDE